jgi:hypothetical protein
MNLVNPTAKFYSRGNQRNLFCIFLSFSLFSRNFGTLKEFPRILIQKKKLEIGNYWNSNGPILAHILATLVRPSGQIARSTHIGGAVGVRPRRGHHARSWHGGATDVDMPTVPGRLGLWVKHRRGWVHLPGSKVATGAHWLGVATMRRLGAAARWCLTAVTGSGGSCSNAVERGG